MGVPKPVRLKVIQKYEDDDRARGGYESYFDFIDYQKIALHNWTLLQSLLGYGTGGKDKQVSWMSFVNSKRNLVYHASSGKSLNVDDLLQLETYERWLAQKIGEMSPTNESNHEVNAE